ncbi:MAG: hypothetical protein JEZ03_15570 [Bacteroidales bacterium]|nr:hypothetical protein [Bacteroidales bacterium]
MSHNELLSNWKKLKISDTGRINSANYTLHQAVQTIALAGKQLITQQADDSNTNMKWHHELNSFVGNWIDGKIRFRIGFDVINFRFQNMDIRKHIISEFPLAGKTKLQAFEWLKEQAENYCLSGFKLKNELLNEPSSHDSSRDTTFVLPEKELLEELCFYRANADLLLRTFYCKYEHASRIRIWPHHFDTGSYIPMKYDENGIAQKSFSIGMATPDELINDHYFYITTWTNNKIEYSILPEFSGKGSWNTKGWTGAVLPLSRIIEQQSSEQQVDIATQFFSEGIDFALKLLKL